jgi:hypothetical protein
MWAAIALLPLLAQLAAVSDQPLVKGIGFFIRTGQLRFPAGMNGAEDMVVDHNKVVTQAFRHLGKRLDNPCIAAEFGSE